LSQVQVLARITGRMFDVLGLLLAELEQGSGSLQSSNMTAAYVRCSRSANEEGIVVKTRPLPAAHAEPSLARDLPPPISSPMATEVLSSRCMYIVQANCIPQHLRIRLPLS